MDELEYQAEEVYSLRDSGSYGGVAWLKYVMWGLVFASPVLIGFFAASNRLAVALFAYVNCLLYGVFAIHFIKNGSLGCLIPLIAPVWLILGNCVGIIYFSFFYPDAVYTTMAGEISYFAGGIRYQLAIFIFLLAYFVSMSWLLRNDGVILQHPSMVSKYVGYLSIAFAVPIICLHMLTMAATLTNFIGVWGHRLYNYYVTLLFVAGVVIVRLSRVVKTALVVFLAIVLVFYSMGSSRAWAIFPIASLISGLFFFSEVKARTKVILLVSGIVVLPWFMLISNVTRLVLGGAGHFEDLPYIWSTLKDWKQITKHVPADVTFFGRMFFPAGNVIVAYSPTQYPYRHFSAAGYAKEALVCMLPLPVQKFTGIMLDEREAQYTGWWMLLQYDIFVSESTSVPPSTIGNLWMFGGYIPVFIGGFLLALIHSFIAWIVRSGWRRSPDRGVFYFSVFYFIIFWSLNWDLIHIWRTIVLQFIAAYVGFKLISPFLKIGYASMAENLGSTSDSPAVR